LGHCHPERKQNSWIHFEVVAAPRLTFRQPLYLDHPQFEGFEVRRTVRRGEDAVA
jgi:hypothetical protein